MKSEWKKIPIKDLCIGIYDGPHATPPKSDSGAVFLGIPNFSNGRLDLSNVRYISEDDLPRWTKRVTPQAHDIVFSYEATLNLYAIIPDGFHGCLGRRMALMRPDESKVNYKFLYYYMFSSEWREEIERHKVFGSTVDRIPLISFPSFMVNLPDMATQEYIANILSALDEKIALNNKINENLEQQAQLLYKQYFPYSVNDKLPDGWHVGAVGEIVEIHDAKRIPLSGAERAKMKKKTYPYYGAAALMDYVDDYIFDGKYLLLGEDGTVVDNAGYPILQYVWGQFWVNNHAHVLTGKLGFNVESLYMLFKHTQVKSIVTGAVQPKISQANLRSIPVVIPPENLLIEYNSQIEPMFALFRANDKASKTLTVLRDTLLPKLMNGEIDVADIAL